VDRIRKVISTRLLSSEMNRINKEYHHISSSNRNSNNKTITAIPRPGLLFNNLYQWIILVHLINRVFRIGNRNNLRHGVAWSSSPLIRNQMETYTINGRSNQTRTAVNMGHYRTNIEAPQRTVNSRPIKVANQITVHMRIKDN
jgi:hypothetical protein